MEVICSHLCLKPVQIWISLFNDQKITDKYPSRGPTLPGSTVSSFWSSAERPGWCGRCWVWSGRCCPARRPRQLQSSRLPTVTRASGCWRSSCSWCPGTPCPGQPAWSWWGSAHSYWWVGFQVCSGPDLPFYKLGTSRRPQLWPFSGCRLPAGDCLNHASVSCQWWFIIIVKYMMFYLQVWPDLKAICTATRNSSIYQWQERICVLAARPLKKMLLLEISESLL